MFEGMAEEKKKKKKRRFTIIVAIEIGKVTFLQEKILKNCCPKFFLQKKKNLRHFCLANVNYKSERR